MDRTATAITMTIETDLYAVLGVKSSASTDEIKKAFRSKAAEFHPDRNSSELAPARFRAVREAYEVLSDPDARTSYDDNRRRNLLESPLETAQEIWSNYVAEVLK
jgi:DnaJ-class molecular chaperone